MHLWNSNNCSGIWHSDFLTPFGYRIDRLSAILCPQSYIAAYRKSDVDPYSYRVCLPMGAPFCLFLSLPYPFTFASLSVCLTPCPCQSNSDQNLSCITDEESPSLSIAVEITPPQLQKPEVETCSCQVTRYGWKPSGAGRLEWQTGKQSLALVIRTLQIAS